MIKLKLIRTTPKDINQNYTHGELFIWEKEINEWLYFCLTLEDKVRDYNKDGDLLDEGEQKISGQTAIPFGKYEGFLRMSPKRKRLIPELKDVPHFKNIQIHSGNNINHTLGCILIGYKSDFKGKIWESSQAEQNLIKIIENDDSKFTIEII